MVPFIDGLFQAGGGGHVKGGKRNGSITHLINEFPKPPKTKLGRLALNGIEFMAPRNLRLLVTHPFRCKKGSALVKRSIACPSGSPTTNPSETVQQSGLR
jgi:hypothetical protein